MRNKISTGLLLVRELDERFGIERLIAENIRDDRCGKNTQLPLPNLLDSPESASGERPARDIEKLLRRPVGRPSYELIVWCKGFL